MLLWCEVLNWKELYTSCRLKIVGYKKWIGAFLAQKIRPARLHLGWSLKNNFDDWGSPTSLYAVVEATVLLLYSFGSLALVDIFEVSEYNYVHPWKCNVQGWTVTLGSDAVLPTLGSLWAGVSNSCCHLVWMKFVYYVTAALLIFTRCQTFRRLFSFWGRGHVTLQPMAALILWGRSLNACWSSSLEESSWCCRGAWWNSCGGLLFVLVD